jgi:hypothetical protein
MTTQHFDPPGPAQFAGWTGPIPDLTRSMFSQETPVLNFFGNALLH